MEHLPFGSQTAIRYKLTEKGQKEIIQIQMQFRGQLDFERETVSRQPLRLFGGVDTEVGKPLPRSFTRTYTIDTLLGRWCPLAVWSVVEKAIEEDEGFTVFVDKFTAATDPAKLKDISGQEAAFEQTLLEPGYIEFDELRRERWMSKIAELRNNKEKLRRIL